MNLSLLVITLVRFPQFPWSTDVIFLLIGPSALRPLHSLDLSKAAKLKDVEFRLRGPSINWISRALQTARSENLRQISIILSFYLPNPDQEAVRLEWQDLDDLLVELWTTRSIRSVFTLRSGTGGRAKRLLPGLASRGAI